MPVPLFVALFVVLLILCLISATLSALETALFCLREHHEPALAGDDDSFRRDLRALIEAPNREFNHVLLLGATVNLTVATIALFLLREEPFSLKLPPVPTAIVAFGGIILVTDLLPKLVALARPASVFRFTARPILCLRPVLMPVAEALSQGIDALTSFFVPGRAEPTEELAEEELETLVEVHRDKGVLMESESEMIQEILRLGNKTARDCMTPRVDAVVMSGDLSAEEADAFIREHNHYFIPVYRESLDTIIGTLDVKACLVDGTRPFQDFIAPPVFVAETMMALDIFKDYLQQPRSLAIVLDEFGGMEGVLTQTDLIEEIISDAAPQADPHPDIQDLGKNRLLVAGNARLDEIGEILDLSLERDGIDTIGGLLFTLCNRLPYPGEKIRLDEILATVRKCSALRIEELLIEKAAQETGSTQGETS